MIWPIKAINDRKPTRQVEGLIQVFRKSRTLGATKELSPLTRSAYQTSSIDAWEAGSGMRATNETTTQTAQLAAHLHIFTGICRDVLKVACMAY